MKNILPIKFAPNFFINRLKSFGSIWRQKFRDMDLYRVVGAWVRNLGSLLKPGQKYQTVLENLHKSGEKI